MASTINILAFGGSQRKGSTTFALLREAQRLAPAGVTITVHDISSIPLYNQDLEQNLPPAVVAFKAAVKAADAVLISTPEFNYSVPGSLKNAIDWLSRPYGDNSLDGKPAAIMSASMGQLAGSRAQYHLRQILVFLNVHPLNRPEMMVPEALAKFDASGNLTDAKTKEKLAELLVALVDWTKRIAPKGA